MSSRLLEYEVWCRIHGLALAETHGEAARTMLAHVALVELARPVVARALDPFPVPVRTLDTLHLATMDFLRERGQDVSPASYDQKLTAAARRLGFSIADL